MQCEPSVAHTSCAEEFGSRYQMHKLSKFLTTGCLFQIKTLGTVFDWMWTEHWIASCIRGILKYKKKQML